MQFASFDAATSFRPVMEPCESRMMLANTYDFITVVIEGGTGQAATAVPPGTYSLDDLGLGVAKPFFPDSSEFDGINDLFEGDNLQNLVDGANAATDLAELSVIEGDDLPGIAVTIPDLADLTFSFSNATQETVDFVLAVEVDGQDFGSLNGEMQYHENVVTPGEGEAGIVDNVLIVNGTSGNDVITLTSTDTGVEVNINGTVSNFASADFGTISVSGGDGADTIKAGGVGTQMIVKGGAGNDYLLGGRRNDQLYGEAGNDTVSGGAGKNQLFGGDDNDRLQGSNGPDLLKGEAGKDRLYGRGGDDVMDGGGGADRFFAGDGNDVLLGGGSNDRMLGEGGDDTFSGGTGTNFIDGGDGDDTAPDDDEDTLLSIENLV